MSYVRSVIIKVGFIVDLVIRSEKNSCLPMLELVEKWLFDQVRRKGYT